MKHRATKTFWKLYKGLPSDVRRSALKQYRLLRQNPHHSSLRFKPVGKLWSARVNDSYRVLAIKRSESYVWFYIGPHDGYDKIIRQYQ